MGKYRVQIFKKWKRIGGQQEQQWIHLLLKSEKLNKQSGSEPYVQCINMK